MICYEILGPICSTAWLDHLHFMPSFHQAQFFFQILIDSPFETPKKSTTQGGQIMDSIWHRHLQGVCFLAPAGLRRTRHKPVMQMQLHLRPLVVPASLLQLPPLLPLLLPDIRWYYLWDGMIPRQGGREGWKKTPSKWGNSALIHK